MFGVGDSWTVGEELVTLASVVGVIDGADWCCPCDAGGAGGRQEVLVVELVGAVG